MTKFIQSKKGAQGVGTLIVFISLILVSGIAAAVLTTTATSIQSKAYDIGGQTDEKITRGLEVVQVFTDDVSDGSINETVDNIKMNVRLAVGSEAIKLEDIIVTLDTESSSNVFEAYPGGLPLPIHFQTTYLTNNAIAQNTGYIMPGELVEIAIVTPVNITEQESFKVGFTGSNLFTNIISITTPNAMVRHTTKLYP